MKLKCISLIFIVFSFIGYGSYADGKLPGNETISVTPLQSTGVIDIVTTDEKRWVVHYEQRKDELYIECFINDFSFSKETVGTQHVEGEGHIRLYVDDEHIDTLYEGAFIVKGMSQGTHDVQVVLVKNDRTPYELEETFQITIL